MLYCPGISAHTNSVIKDELTVQGMARIEMKIASQ